jgi:hypothetical protein
MSSKLISEKYWQHVFLDDLESSIYVLLWVILNYSRCSNPAAVLPFLKSVLDPEPIGDVGGYYKADFLKGRTFLSNVSFPGRPALHHLIVELATLFQARNMAPLQLIEQLPKTNEEGLLYFQARTYVQSMEYLKDHDYTIALFDEALGSSGWPTINDTAVKQVFVTSGHSASKKQKTGWSTAIFVREIDQPRDLDKKRKVSRVKISKTK